MAAAMLLYRAEDWADQSDQIDNVNLEQGSERMPQVIVVEVSGALQVTCFRGCWFWSHTRTPRIPASS